MDVKMSLNLTEYNLSPEAIAGWSAFASSELFPILTKELAKRGYGKQLNGLLDVFVFLVYTLFICGCLNQATIWICETVFSRDIDGDGIKGKPQDNEQHVRPRRRSTIEGCEEIEISRVGISVGFGSSDSIVEHSDSTKESSCEIQGSTNTGIPIKSI